MRFGAAACFWVGLSSGRAGDEDAELRSKNAPFREKADFLIPRLLGYDGNRLACPTREDEAGMALGTN